MKRMCTEEQLRSCIKELQQKEEAKLIMHRKFNEPVVAEMIKKNGNARSVKLILAADSEGLLAVMMASSKSDKIRGYQYFKYSGMQGIQVKEKTGTVRIVIQFLDGTRYIFRIGRKNTGMLPHQKEYLEHIVFMLESQNRHDMDNEYYKKLRRKEKVFNVVYCVTLLLFLLMIAEINSTLKSGYVMMVLSMIAGVLLHLAVIIFFSIMSEKIRNQKFYKEYNPIIKEYTETQDAQECLRKLTDIREKPGTREASNAYHISLSTMYCRLGEKEKAFQHIILVQTTDENLLEAVRKQREWIGM